MAWTGEQRCKNSPDSNVVRDFRGASRSKHVRRPRPRFGLKARSLVTFTRTYSLKHLLPHYLSQMGGLHLRITVMPPAILSIVFNCFPDHYGVASGLPPFTGTIRIGVCSRSSHSSHSHASMVGSFSLVIFFTLPVHVDALIAVYQLGSYDLHCRWLAQFSDPNHDRTFGSRAADSLYPANRYTSPSRPRLSARPLRKLDLSAFLPFLLLHSALVRPHRQSSAYNNDTPTRSPLKLIQYLL